MVRDLDKVIKMGWPCVTKHDRILVNGLAIAVLVGLAATVSGTVRGAVHGVRDRQMPDFWKNPKIDPVQCL